MKTIQVLVCVLFARFIVKEYKPQIEDSNSSRDIVAFCDGAPAVLHTHLP